MRLAFFATALLSATAFAVPSAKADSADLVARAPNAMPAAAPVALPVAEAAPVPISAELEPLLHALMTRSLEERQDIFTQLGGILGDLGPILSAVLSLINSQTIVELKSIIDNAYGLLIQTNRILTPNNTDLIVGLLADVAPLLQEVGPLISGLSSLLSGLLGIFLGNGTK